MTFSKSLFLSLLCVGGLAGHPMGNFSINHYSKLQANARGIDLAYALDLAEIPTFELLRSWNLDRSSAQSALNSRAAEQSREWLSRLKISSDGTPVKARFESARLVIADGAGNLPILRITTLAHINSTGGKLAYEDLNFPDRAGWKEIVIANGSGATISQASQSSRDISHALTQYPADPTLAPPQILRAEMRFAIAAPKQLPVVAQAPVIKEIPQPHVARAASSPATLTAQSAPAGAVVRGDFLSRLLHQRSLTPWMMLLALGAAFALGAVHALTPGHGKAIVAAYLVGSRGTLKHAAFLGAMVTFTHTIVVFGLGLATLFLFRFIVPEKITEWLGAISGLSIVAIGGYMLYQRVRRRPVAQHSHNHSDHSHSHAHDHGHTHDHASAHVHHHAHDHDHKHSHGDVHAHGHDHSHGHDHHHHGPGGHTHVPAEISWRGLVALGASGGLVPCESALVLLLGAIALGRVGLGLLLLLSFSLGLALVLMTIGVLVLYAKRLLPEGKRTGSHPLLHWVSVASPAIVMIVGLIMTGVSLGWIQSKWMIG